MYQEWFVQPINNDLSSKEQVPKTEMWFIYNVNNLSSLVVDPPFPQ